jgi:hypothetical protein
MVKLNHDHGQAGSMYRFILPPSCDYLYSGGKQVQFTQSRAVLRLGKSTGKDVGSPTRCEAMTNSEKATTPLEGITVVTEPAADCLNERQQIDPQERDRWNAYPAHRLEKPKLAVTPYCYASEYILPQLGRY